MSEPKQILLFGDQTNSFDDGIRKLAQRKENPYLQAFLERCNFAIRAEIGNLPLSLRDQFPRFSSILDLLASYRKTNDNPALEGALTCVHQITSFIAYYGESSRSYPAAAQSYINGLCTGLLAASAISSAKAVADITPAGVEAVLVAFRTGLRTMEVRDRICKKSAKRPDWSVVISGMDEETALPALRIYSRSKGLPKFSQPYVSAINANSVTVSGPPTTLQQLLQASPFSDRKTKSVPVHSPFHAPHLYTEADIDTILSKSSSDILNSFTPKIPIISSTTGNTILPKDFGTLLRTCLHEILLEPFRFEKVLMACSDIAKSSNSSCRLVPVATNASQALNSALRQAGNEVKVDDIVGSVPEWDTLKTGRAEQSKIAILGISGRFPDAESTEAFWDLLYEGLDVHREVPPDRFDIKTHFDPTGKRKNTMATPYGCFIPNPGHFDARFFNMSPKEAAQCDPAQRLALITAYEALEQAGFVANRTPSSQRDRVGVFYGTCSDDWREINEAQNIDTYFIPGGIRAFVPGRVNYHFKFSGPSIDVDTACSSSLAAIHTACNALWKGDCDTALTGGTNVLTNPDNFTGLDRGHFLSRTGNCKTFDDGADGYCRADGVGSVVLKRLEDAEADNDPIMGVIMGAGTNHSAEAVSITRPDANAQTYIFDKVLNQANVDANDISYIEMHGTGTQAGDAVEMSSCLGSFAPDTKYRKQPLHLGSVKANVGHAEAASGITSLIKVMLMMKESMIPPHCGIKTKINHNFPTDLAQRDVHIAFKPTPWRRPANKKRRVFLNNFSAAGGNTALLLEDAPIREVADKDPRPVHPVAVSGRSLNSAQNNAQNLIKHINDTRGLSLANLSYTTTARRLHSNYRILVSGSDLDQIAANLEKAAMKDNIASIPSTSHHVAFAFTGQGSQYAGMGKELYENFSTFRSDILQLDTIVQSQGFPSIMPVIEGGSEMDLLEVSPVIVQLASCCLQMALAQLWASWGVHPSVVVGHSLGEYAALNVAGVLSASDTIYLCGKRAELLVNKCEVGTHSMLAVKAPATRINSFMEGRTCEIACINGPEETVIAGTNANIDMFAQDLTNAGIKATKLRVPFAFHSAQVEPILEEFEETARGITFNKPSTPIISPLLGEVVTTEGTFSAHYLARHCRKSVNFLDGLNAAKGAHLINDSDLSVEIGPHSVCSGMIKSTFGPKFVALPSLRRKEDPWKTILGTLSSLHTNGVDLNWGEYHHDHDQYHEVLQLPSYSWDIKNHWLQYVNDWCLTKGDAPLSIAAPPSKPALSTTSVQKVIKESGDDESASITIESDIADDALYAVLQGHKVNGTALCPSTLWADIALTVGDHLVQTYNPDSHDTSMDIADMTVVKPLIASKDKSTQLIRATAKVDWSMKSGKVEIYAVDKEGKKTVDHASCMIRYGDGHSWQAEWQRTAYLIRPRLSRLHKDVDEGNTNHMKRGMAYRVFSTMVEYAPPYRGFEDVILDSKELEGTAHVKFQTHEEDGNFLFSPFWLDSFGHLSGFVMNGNDAVDLKKTAYINHGWESVKFADVRQFSSSTTYQTYVKMQPFDDTTFIGDVFIFDDAKIVGLYKGVKFQGIPRRILDNVLPPAGGAKTVASAPSAKATPKKAESKPKTPKKVNIASPASSSPPVLDQAMSILAEEIGVTREELSDETEFNDVGVDSLLSLTICGRFKEQLNVDPESSIFTECPSVGHFKSYFSKNHSGASTAAQSTAPSTPDFDPSEDGQEPADSSITTPDSEEEPANKTMETIKQIFIEETGLDIAELTDDADFAELGMDSLMTLTITGRVREELPQLEISDSFFTDNSSLSKIATALNLTPRQPEKVVAPPASQPQTVSTPPSNPTSSHPKASSILLSGNPQTAAQTLWLFPDGSGSATSYAPMPKASDSVVIYGLNCPYMKTPDQLTCSLEGLTPPYLAEIKRRQPSGPYNLGGWSAGGISAFDAAQKLTEEGEKVDRLVFIDSPFPIGIEKLPPNLYDYFKAVGFFGGGEPPSWLIQHFLSFTEALDKYSSKAKTFPKGKAPKAHFIWAEDGVIKDAGGKTPDGYTNSGSDSKEMRWLLEQRTDFGDNGYARLLGGRENCRIETIQGANHFSMMEKKENATKVAGFLGRSMEV